MNRMRGSFFAWPLLILGSLLPAGPVFAQDIPVSSLLQYQYRIDVPECNVKVGDGLKVEFDGVFANEGDSTIFYDLVNLNIRANSEFRIASLIRLITDGGVFSGKVVYNQPGKLVIATTKRFADVLLTRPDAFTIATLPADVPQERLTVSYRENYLAAKAAIQRGLACYQDAMDVN